ncbi:MAG: HD domain-containing protein [Alphaproteobacteria bacterium]|nr:HD domain-containing protein [Alphaproteobacteria bacterium]
MTDVTTSTVETIRRIFTDHGMKDYLGEDVTMAEHMLQAAHQAEGMGGDPLTVVGALLHDIGQFTSAFGTITKADTRDRYQEDAGAEVLK